MSEPIRIALVTAPSGDEALRIARALVDDERAACVNVIPGIRSVYLWEGRREESAEDLLVIKAPAAALDRLRSRVVELHPYDVPEFVVLAVDDGLPAYLDWVAASVPGGG